MTSEVCVQPWYGRNMVAFGTAGATVLTAVATVGELGSGLLALDVAVGLVSCALVPVLWRRPVAGALAVSALAVLSPSATPAATLAVLYVAQRLPLRWAVGVALAGIAAHALLGAWRPAGGLSYPWWLLLMAVAYAALIGWGALLKSRRELLMSLRERAVRAEAERDLRVAEARMHERTRIAREMHDVLAHRLSLVATYAGALEYRPDLCAQQLSQAAGVVRAGVHQALAELRDVIGVLRDPLADDDDRPQPVLADVPRLVQESRDAGAAVALDDQAGAQVPTAIGRTAYRVVQEGLTNARKHAPGQPVRITMAGQPGGRLVIDIRNPTGTASTMPGAGTGLIGLTERVRLSGGQLAHDLAGTGEFRLHVWLPWPS